MLCCYGMALDGTSRHHLGRGDHIQEGGKAADKRLKVHTQGRSAPNPVAVRAGAR